MPAPPWDKAGAGVAVGPAAGDSELVLEVLRLDRRTEEDLGAASGCGGTEVAGGNSKGAEGAGTEDSKVF